LELFHGYRKSIGEDRSLPQAPFHIFDPNESTNLECILDLAAFFLWDAVAFSLGSQERGINLTNDEVLEVFGNGEALEALIGITQVCGLKSL
jgi:hypothetical protein